MWVYDNKSGLRAESAHRQTHHYRDTPSSAAGASTPPVGDGSRVGVVHVEPNPGVLWDPGGHSAGGSLSTRALSDGEQSGGIPYRILPAGGEEVILDGKRYTHHNDESSADAVADLVIRCNQTEQLLLTLNANNDNLSTTFYYGDSGGSYWNCSYLLYNNSTNGTYDGPQFRHATLGVLLTIFAMVTVLGNLLVIIAIARERYLRTVTNYFIVSLAIADTVIGALVMPFNIVLEMTNQMWYFGADWCDVWHSFDVLASTASILNLTVISLDRYWAITDPIAYPSKMSTGRAFILIALVWICSAAISFPAILWWRLVATERRTNECAFTEDAGYLIFSSIVSFYIPMSVIIFAYYKIYVAAAKQIRSLKAGAKVMSTNGDSGQVMTLRMHRGGGRQFNDEHIHYARAAANSDSDADSPSHGPTRQHGTSPGGGPEGPDDIRPSRMISRKWKHFALSRKLSKLAKEQKAAKTLGIVMGVFCICWVPFFVTNVLYGICYLQCVPHAGIVFPIFTWLGYINSGMNPIIYACSMRDFRRAFTKILLCCCPRYSLLRSRTRRRQHQHYNHGGSFSSTSHNVIVTCGERCSNTVL